MPIYEYTCCDCQTQIELFFRSFDDTETNEAACPHCRGTNLERLVSRSAVIQAGERSEKGRTISTDPPRAAANKEDPKTLAQVMRQANKVAGQDLGSEFNEVAARLESGQKASSIEQSLRKRTGQDKQVH